MRKQERAKEEIDVAGERFLHDHDKCVDARKATMSPFYLDLVLPGHGKLLNAEDKIACNLIITKSANDYCFCEIFCDYFYYYVH